MSEIITRLCKEHADMSRLLDLLERQLDLFATGEHYDYDVIRAIIDYCLDYPDAVHHPKEDLIYRVLKDRAPDLEGELVDLEAEHAKLRDGTMKLSEALRQVLAEELVDRTLLQDMAREFLDVYRHHIAREEREIFPAAERILSAAEWAEIDARLESREDPLFGGEVAERYNRLRKDIDSLATMAENT